MKWWLTTIIGRAQYWILGLYSARCWVIPELFWSPLTPTHFNGSWGDPASWKIKAKEGLKEGHSQFTPCSMHSCEVYTVMWGESLLVFRNLSFMPLVLGQAAGIKIAQISKDDNKTQKNKEEPLCLIYPGLCSCSGTLRCFLREERGELMVYISDNSRS